MKILISRLSFGQIGGAELSARDIARALQQLGHMPLLVTNLTTPIVLHEVDHHVAAPQPLRITGTISALMYLPRLLTQFIFYYRIVKRFDPDLIHPHSRHDQLVLTVIGKVLRKPVVWRDPGDLVPQLTMQLKNPLQKLNRRLQSWSLRNASHVIVLNENDYKIIHKLTGLERRKVSIIGSDIMLRDYVVHPNKIQGATTYGVISRLDKHKGIQYAIQAFQKLSIPNTRLLIAGDGSYRPELENLANLHPAITFLGKMDNSSDFYNQIDILIQPSEFEGWGRTVKEAMFFRIPVIGSDTGGIADQINHGSNGLLFSVGNIEELTNLMKQVQDKKLSRKLITGGKKTVERDGDWVVKVKNQYVPLFERFV